MKKSMIIYKSRNGTTKKLGENIAEVFKSVGVQTQVKSIEEADPADISEYDYVVLGCWTSGLLFFMQHPEKAWVDFAEKVSTLDCRKTILFTTYKIRTGSMFRNMIKYLTFDESNPVFTLKSRNGQLSEYQNKLLLNEIRNKIGVGPI